MRFLILVTFLLVAACGGDDAASSAARPATLGSFEKTYGILAGRTHGMPVMLTTSTGTAGFAVFAYDEAADRGQVSYVVCVEKPCPAQRELGARTFRSPPLSVVERYDDQAVFRTAPGAATEVAVTGMRLRSGAPTELVIDVRDPPKAHLEGALYPFKRAQ